MISHENSSLGLIGQNWAHGHCWCKGELGKWVSCKGAWEFYDWLSHASCFWAGHMASLNKNMDSNREEQKGNGY